MLAMEVQEVLGVQEGLAVMLFAFGVQLQYMLGQYMQLVETVAMAVLVEPVAMAEMADIVKLMVQI